MGFTYSRCSTRASKAANVRRRDVPLPALCVLRLALLGDGVRQSSNSMSDSECPGSGKDPTVSVAAQQPSSCAYFSTASAAIIGDNMRTGSKLRVKGTDVSSRRAASQPTWPDCRAELHSMRPPDGPALLHPASSSKVFARRQPCSSKGRRTRPYLREHKEAQLQGGAQDRSCICRNAGVAEEFGTAFDTSSSRTHTCGAGSTR